VLICYSQEFVVLTVAMGPKQNKEEAPLPFAEVLRRRRQQATRHDFAEQRGKEQLASDLDEEIKRLEAELAQEDESSTGGGDDDSQSQNNDRVVSFSNEAPLMREYPSDPHDDPQQSVICLSSLAKDRIEPLPASCLPTISRKRDSSEGPDYVKEKKLKTRPQRLEHPYLQPQDGLRAAVQEVLSGYKARSSERLPFYCRACVKQYSTEEEFFTHKKTAFHKTAVEEERKASYCKLCKKQLTSPVQLKEHLNSKPHKERLHSLQMQQSNRNDHGRRGGRQQDGSIRRQWV
jgi:hypothetical protein